jgi:hypothetical protein
VAATKTKKKRRTRPKDAPITSGTTYHVVDVSGTEVVRATNHPMIAVLRAQSVAERVPETYTYYIERRTLFGDPVELFSVDRDEHGVVRTFTLTKED